MSDFKKYFFITFIAISLWSVYGFNSKSKIDYRFSYNGKYYNSGDTIYGYKNYVKLVVGDYNAPLLLAAPHGGTEKGMPEIPDSGDDVSELNTIPLTLEIAHNFYNLTKKRPWIVINTIIKRKVNPNTLPQDVAKRYTNDEARTIYLSYHSLLMAARLNLAKNHKNTRGAIFLDIHGHSHKYIQPRDYMSAITGKTVSSLQIEQIELGYGLSKKSLLQSDSYLNKIADSSSIANISRMHLKVPFSEIVRGKYSLGALLENENYIAVPSPKIKGAEASAELFGLDARGYAKNRPYFGGGYCIQRYGTSQKGSVIGFNDNIPAIQIHFPRMTARVNQDVIEVTAIKFNKSIIEYLNRWLGYNFKKSN